MKNITFVSPERQVNLLDPNVLTAPFNGLIGAQTAPHVAALANGNFAVVYENPFRGDTGDVDIMGVEVTAAGVVVSSSLLGVEYETGQQNQPDVAPRLAGGYAAVWSDVTDSHSIKMAFAPPVAAYNPPEFYVARISPTSCLRPVDRDLRQRQVYRDPYQLRRSRRRRCPACHRHHHRIVFARHRRQFGGKRISSGRRHHG